MATFTVDVVSAERKLWSGEATGLFFRTTEGSMGVLPGHQPALLALDIGVVRVRTTEGEVEKVAVHHGFLYFRDDHLVILADIAEVASMIDEQRAERRLREMEGRRGEEEDAHVQASVRKQRARLSVVA